MSRGKQKTGRKSTCHRCGYQWLTLAHTKYLSCPSCGIKTLGLGITSKEIFEKYYSRTIITHCPGGTTVIDEAPKEWTSEQIIAYQKYDLEQAKKRGIEIRAFEIEKNEISGSEC